MTKEEVNYLISALPEKPPEGLIGWAQENCVEDLGGDYLIFHNQRITETPGLELLMDNITTGKSRWMTVCQCTACGSDFVTQKTGRRSFLMADGEDGYSYPISEMGVPEEDLWERGVAWNGVEYTEWDRLSCPFCEEDLRVIHKSGVRGGRTKRLQVAQLTNVGQYTAIILWLVEREVWEDGCCDSCQPRFAYVLGHRGEMKAFTHRRPGYLGIDTPAPVWSLLPDSRDRWNARYSDWGSTNNTKVGTASWNQIPRKADMVGTTGEKSGIWDYWEACGYRPVEYWKLWKKRKNVENLVTAGFTSIVSKAIERGLQYGSDVTVELGKAVDIRESKPHKMLGVTRQELKILQKHSDPYALLGKWKSYRAGGGRESLEIFCAAFRDWGEFALDAGLELISRYGGNLGKLRRYMDKQGLSGRAGLRLLLDTRRNQERLFPGQPLTEEELWPRDLQQTHDRLSAQIVQLRQKEKTMQWQPGFDRVLKKYADLQWNDGHLAVLLPKSNADLLREGKILRHCVGSYGEEHSKGEWIVLFVRHYRRPERCYYTLNMNFGGDVPTEIQLHGYGNERHGDHKQYAHTIPKEVRAFVERWKKEVVAPWWRQQNQTAKEKTA